MPFFKVSQKIQTIVIDTSNTPNDISRLSVKDFGAVGDGLTNDTAAIQLAINGVSTDGGEVYFPSGTYLINSTFQISSVNRVKLLGGKGSTLLVDSSINFLNIISSSNIEISGLTFKEKTYSDDVYFNEIALNPSTLLTPNANSNISALISSPTITLSANANTSFQAIENYTISINLDNTKEHTLQTYDGIVLGENSGSILIRKYTDTNTYKEYTVDNQNQTSSSAGYFRWHSNYIEAGIIKIELLFPYSKIFNSDNNSVTYDMSKIRLFQANRTLLDSVDSFNISIQNSKNIVFKDNIFIGLQRNVIASPSSNEDIFFIGNSFTNCLIGHIQISNMTRCLIENNKFIIKLNSDTGREVYYTKACTRGVSGHTASTNVTIRNNYAYGLYFGSEIWFSTNLFIDRFTMEKVQWGFSICNSSTGVISNCSISLRDNFRYVIELAQNVAIDVDNLRVTGRSYSGLVFSLTDNLAGKINISNVKIDSCFIFCQFTDNSVNLKNIEVKELLCIGVFALHGGDYSLSTLSMENCNFAYSSVLKINNPAYSPAFIRTNSTVYINKIILRDCEFTGRPSKHHLDIKTTELFMDNVYFDSPTQYKAQLNIKDVNNKMSSLRNSQLYNININEYYQNSTNSKLVLQDNKLNQTIVPSHANVISSNNQTIV